MWLTLAETEECPLEPLVGFLMVVGVVVVLLVQMVQVLMAALVQV
jgi:hypothetical protein